MWTDNLQMYMLDLQMAEESEIKLPASVGSYKKLEGSRKKKKKIHFCFIGYDFDSVAHNKLWKIFQEMRIPDHLTCLLRNLYAGQKAIIRNFMEKLTGSKLEKEYIKAVYCHLV